MPQSLSNHISQEELISGIPIIRGEGKIISTSRRSRKMRISTSRELEAVYDAWHTSPREGRRKSDGSRGTHRLCDQSQFIFSSTVGGDHVPTARCFSRATIRDSRVPCSRAEHQTVSSSDRRHLRWSLVRATYLFCERVCRVQDHRSKMIVIFSGMRQEIRASSRLVDTGCDNRAGKHFTNRESAKWWNSTTPTCS